MHLLVTQPYVPAYRVPLFNRIAELLSDSGDTLTIAAGTPSGEQSRRGDDRAAEWRVTYKTRAIRVAKHTVQWRTVPKTSPSPDVIVSELEALNTFGWASSFGSAPLILWGHGKSYVNDPNRLADRLEWALAKRAAHVMTYTPSGRDFLLREGGISPERVTAIGNSTDTRVLRDTTLELRNPSSITPRDAACHALYVGGLDPAKRIDFVLKAASEAHRQSPAFHLTVVGKGVFEGQIEQLSKSVDYLTYIPESRGADLARLANTADAIWMPGRVGLVAVDALAMGVPIHTTDYSYHAPEIEFLREGEVVRLPDSARTFALASLKAMASGKPELRDDIPSIDSVAKAFVGVVDAVLAR